MANTARIKTSISSPCRNLASPSSLASRLGIDWPLSSANTKGSTSSTPTRSRKPRLRFRKDSLLCASMCSPLHDGRWTVDGDSDGRSVIGRSLSAVTTVYRLPFTTYSFRPNKPCGSTNRMMIIKSIVDAGTIGGEGFQGSSRKGRLMPIWPYLMMNCCSRPYDNSASGRAGIAGQAADGQRNQ